MWSQCSWRRYWRITEIDALLSHAKTESQRSGLFWPFFCRPLRLTPVCYPHNQNRVAKVGNLFPSFFPMPAFAAQPLMVVAFWLFLSFLSFWVFLSFWGRLSPFAFRLGAGGGRLSTSKPPPRLPMLRIVTDLNPCRASRPPPRRWGCDEGG